MSNNKKLLGHTFFKKELTVGKFKLNALSGARMLILDEVGNPLATGEEDADAKWSVYEAMMVCVLDAEALLAYNALSPDEWKAKVKAFAMGVEDDELNEFWDLFQAELVEINASKVKEVEGKQVSPGSEG